MIRRPSIMISTAAAIALTAMTIAAGTQTKPPQPRQIPGITAKDTFPGGCVDCHAVTKDGDMRLSTALAKWKGEVPAPLLAKAKAASADPAKVKGKHPPTPNPKANIPQSCLTGCHKKGSTIAPPFTQLVHAIHLSGGGQNLFLTKFQGECTHCHKLDQKTGGWKIGNGSEK
jgi:hypothetical protein